MDSLHRSLQAVSGWSDGNDAKATLVQHLPVVHPPDLSAYTRSHGRYLNKACRYLMISPVWAKERHTPAEAIISVVLRLLFVSPTLSLK